jgi:hypothetical protein
MSIKKFFKESSVGSVSTNDIKSNVDVESIENVKAVLEDNKELVPVVDYADPAKFAKYGSAELYYQNFVENVYKNYPYDGSKKEKQEWYNNLAYFEKYLFDYDYPKTNGYLTLGSSSWTTSTSSITDGTHAYKLSSFPQYIYVRPSTNQSVAGRTDPEKNIYNTATKRISSLLLDKNDGNTVEFWFKEETGSPNTYAIFDVWNSSSIDNSDYERLLVEVLSGNGFYLTYQKGVSGVSRAFIDVNFSSLKSSWHHYALSFKSNASTDKIDITVYVDAKSDLSSNSAIFSVSTGSAISSDFTINGLNANIGSYIYTPVSALTASSWNGRGSVYGSFDEFRFWNKARNHQEIARNWSFHAGGGANTDDSNTDLNLYYKFNEGIINTTEADTKDSIVLDYSGRFTNSLIKNYTKNIRSTGSAINSSGFFDFIEEKDPIIIETNPILSSYLTTKKEEGYFHDLENTSQFYNLFPNWIREEDVAANQDLRKVFQIVATYLDKLYLQIEQLNKIKHTDYLTDKEKSYPFAKELLDSKGLASPDILIDSNILEEISSRDEERPYEEKFNVVKNLIYQNIYNNLTYIYKSKGTEKSFRNLFRAFGVDDEIIKLVLYSNNAEIKLNKDKINYTSVKTNLIDFSFKEHHAATVYQYSTGSNSSVLYGATTTDLELIPKTFECITYLPNQTVKEKLFKWNLNDVSSSIFGVHSAQNTNNDLAWDADDKFNFQVYALRDKKSSKGGRFLLKTNGFGLTSSIALTSSYYNDLYDNTTWNLVVKVRPFIDDYSYLNIDAINPEKFIIEFIGVQSNLDIVQNEFSASYILNAASSSLAAQKDKRVYIGAHRNNFTGSVLQESDIRIISTRCWYDDLDINTIKSHARNFKAFGRNNPSKRSYLGLYEDVLQLDTLALNWDFDTVSGSDSNGQFIVEDRKTYSTNNILSTTTNEKHYGRGDFFPVNSTNPVDVDYLTVGKNELPEQLSTSDTIDIRNEDDIFFTKDTRPVDYFLSLENSMYSIISDEMLNLFSSATDYSNLIGNPLSAYKQNYKELEFIRQKFFEKVDNIPSFERYLNLFKWIDSSINEILKEITPASANVSENISTILESHILERNKYQRKLPIFNYREKTRVNFPIKGINELLNTPISGTSLWNRERLEKNSPLMTTGDANADYNRQTIQNSLNNLNDQKTFKLKNTDNTSYIAPIYVFRKQAKPYRFMVDQPEAPYDAVSSSANIENIPSSKANVYSGRRVPYNYRNNYEVFQTSGRTANNKYLNDISSSLEVKKVESTNATASTVYLDKEAPNRTIQKTVFVERFSAPGSAETNAVLALNEDSAEYSVYNSLNYRNMLVRKNLNAWSAESSSINDTIPSYHKIPKNPKTGLNGETTYDNLFIQQSIPQSDKANSWIKSALAKALTIEPQIKTDAEKTFLLDPDNNSKYVSNARIKFLSNDRFILVYKTFTGFINISLFDVIDSGREKDIELLSTKTIDSYTIFENHDVEIINYEKPIILVTSQQESDGYSIGSVFTIENDALRQIKVKPVDSSIIYDNYIFEPFYHYGDLGGVLNSDQRVFGYPRFPMSYTPYFEPVYSVKRLKDDVFVAGGFQYNPASSTASLLSGSGYSLVLSKLEYSSSLTRLTFATSSFLKLPPYDSSSVGGLFLSYYSSPLASPSVQKIDILPLTTSSFIATYCQDSNFSSSLTPPSVPVIPVVTTGTLRTTYYTLVNYNTSTLDMTLGGTVTSSLIHMPNYDFIGVSGSYAYYSVIYTKRTGSDLNPYFYGGTVATYGTVDQFNRDKNVYLKFMKFNTGNINDLTSSNEIQLGLIDYIGSTKLTELGSLARLSYINYKYNISNNTILNSKNDLQEISDKFLINYSLLSSSVLPASPSINDDLGIISYAGEFLNDQNILGYVTGSLSTMTISNPIATHNFLTSQSLNVKLFTVKNDIHSPGFITAYNDSGLTKIEYCSIADENYFKLYVDEQKYLTEPEVLEKREFYKEYSAFHNEYPNLSGDEYFIFKEQLFDPIIDFAYTNITVLKDYDEETNTISLYSPTSSLKTFLVNTNGFYGFNTWKQIRNNQNPTQVRKARKNQYFIEGKNYKEPVITYKKSLDINVLSDPERNKKYDNQKSTDLQKLKITVPYLTPHEYFANKDLQEKVNSERSFGDKLKKTDYDKVKDTYDEKDSTTEFDFLSHKENLYPKNINTSLTRFRDSYEEEQNTGSNGYERETSAVRTFWKDSGVERYKTENIGFNNLNYQNQTIKTDSNNNLKRGYFYNNLTSSALVGHNIEKIFSIWPLDNFFLYQGVEYDFESYGNLLSSSVTSSSGSVFYTDIEAKTLNVIGDLTFPGHSEERKLTYLIPPNVFGIKPTPRTQFIFNPYFNGVNNEPFGWEWKTNIIAGKNPWFDSYEQYSSDLKLIGKNYSVLPEFRISEYVSAYLAGAIRTINKEFLKLDGVSISSSFIKNTSETVIYPSNSNQSVESNLANSNFRLLLGDFKNLRSFNSGSAKNINLKTSSSKKINYPFNTNVLYGQYVNLVGNLLNQPRYLNSTSLIFNNTGSESYLETNINSISSIASLSSSNGIYAPNLNTASFTISTWFKLSDDVLSNKTPIGLWHLTNAESAITNSFDKPSFGVLLNTSGSIIGENYTSGSIYADTDIVVYNGGQHDIDLETRNVYTFYNNSSSASGNIDFPDTRIILDNKWHNLVVEYFTPEAFTANDFSRDQVEPRQKLFPYGSFEYKMFSTDSQYRFSKTVLLSKENKLISGSIKEENILANVVLLAESGLSSEISGALGISIYKNIGNDFIELERVIKPLSQTFSIDNPSACLEVENLGVKDGKKYFIANVAYANSTLRSLVDEYVICSYSSSLETGSINLINSLTGAAFIGYLKVSEQKPIKPIEFVDNSASSMLIVSQYGQRDYYTNKYWHTSSFYYYDIDYSNKLLTNKTNIKEITSSLFGLDIPVKSIESCLVDSNGYPNKKFIYTFSTGNVEMNYLELGTGGSIVKEQTLTNIGLSTGGINKLYYATSSLSGADKHDNYIILTGDGLRAITVVNGTGSLYYSGQTPYANIYLNDVYLYDNKIVSFGYGNSTTYKSSSFVYGTASYGISPEISTLNYSDIDGALDVTKDNRVRTLSFCKFITPDRKSNYLSSSFSIPLTFVDPQGSTLTGMVAKYNKNRGTNASIKVYLDGQQKYGKLFDSENSTTYKRPILINQPYKEDLTNKQKEFNLNNLKIGYSDNMQYINNPLGFKGELDEFSAWYGNLSSNAVLELYNSGSPSNINELSFKTETANNFESSSFMPTNVTGNVFIWYRLGYAENSTSTKINNLTFNKEFYDYYGESDDLSYYFEDQTKKTHYSRLFNEHTTSVQNITLTVNGITKLLPYNGFYPMQRTSEIAKLLKNSFIVFNQNNQTNNTLTLGSLDIVNIRNNYKKVINDESVTQAALQPFMAPGILFNSIKSGISVDWAAFTGSAASIRASNKPSFYDIATSNGTSSYIISSGSALRIPFETLANLQKFPKRLNSSQTEPIYYLNPTIYNFTSAYEQFKENADSNLKLTNVYPYFIWNGTKASDEFELSMNNFLAETPRFFLKNGALTTFKSKIAKEFRSAVSGNLYVMDISLYKTKNFDMILSPKASSSYDVSGSSGRYFGPPLNYKEGSNINTFPDAESIIADPAYSAYVPPYYYGKSTIRLKYYADKARVTVDDIISKLQFEIINPELDDLISDVSGSLNSVAYLNRMTLDSSLQIRGKEIVPTSVKNGFLEIQSSNDPVNAAENTKWVISTKWECPTMNFNDEEATNKPYNTGDFASNLNTNLTWSYPTAGTGIWSGYSRNYDEKQGIFLKLEESFNGNLSDTTGSLINLCGFEIAEKRVGTLAETKEISEAIVVIPYYEKELYSDTVDQRTKLIKKAQTDNEIFSVDEKHNFIKTDKTQFFNAIKYIDQNRGSIDENNTPNSLVDLALKMEKYELPRHLDFLKDYREGKTNIPPFAMYMFEFKRTLSKEDLGDIWQGVMPEAATIAKNDSIKISHPLTDTELLSSIDKPENLKWLIFKVKRKAEKFYDVLTEFVDTRFKSSNANISNASYNWPYDYFSLVELANVEVKFDIFNDEFYDAQRREVIIRPEQQLPQVVISKLEKPKISLSIAKIIEKLPVRQLVTNIETKKVSTTNVKDAIDRLKQNIPSAVTRLIALKAQEIPKITVKPKINIETTLKTEPLLTNILKTNNKISENIKINLPKPTIAVKTPVLDKLLDKPQIKPTISNVPVVKPAQLSLPIPATVIRPASVTTSTQSLPVQAPIQATLVQPVTSSVNIEPKKPEIKLAILNKILTTKKKG